MPTTDSPSVRAAPPDDPSREALHDEVHARPPARIRLPARVTLVAVLNDGVTRDAEWAHLQRLPGQAGLELDALRGNFLRLRLGGHTLKWERHTEFTRYSIVQPLPATWPAMVMAPLTGRDEVAAADLDPAPFDADWLRHVPGRTIAAIELSMVVADTFDAQAVAEWGQRWFGDRTVVASRLGRGHACAVADFHLGPNGFERMLVLAAGGTSATRAGRISQRLLELETYRMMALRGLPVAKALGPTLQQAEAALVGITAQLEDASSSDQALLDTLTALAARIERATAEHGYRFSATQAYDALVRQRIAELREEPIPGLQTIGEFMQRRLSPAIATVSVTAQRLAALSERVARAGALLRTRVDIATEAQSQQLLAELARGQAAQLKLQATVEGLSIAAISYYVISLLLYGAKALKSAGVSLNPEVAIGAAIPLVIWAVWRTTRRVHFAVRLEKRDGAMTKR